MEFKEFKTEILKRAKESGACQEEYKRAYDSKNFPELLKVITDNFYYSCENNVIDCELLSNIGQETCNESELYFNISTKKGFLIADSATVKASGSATVKAWGSATVEAWGSATVKAWDSATVEAWDSATVKAWGSAYIDSRNTIEHKISDKVILRYYYENRILLAENIETFNKKAKE